MRRGRRSRESGLRSAQGRKCHCGECVNHQHVGPDAGMIGAGVLSLSDPIGTGTPQSPSRGTRQLLKRSVG
ncbi:hypothetical protein Sgleb_67780 [Streptomyces glebosus]|uniref:Uncharacterized protein n=1 Tax=Streptomyces glebosus TaxID=249580 RepID=A0A640T8D5_9ACTN|nr:hypothetical protein Sgleb_67780 [Streptomyces glebosus]